jgi:hypothetical protein
MQNRNEEIRSVIAQAIAESLKEYEGVLLATTTGEQVGPLGGSSNRVLVAFQTDDSVVHGGVVNIYFDNATHRQLTDSLDEIEANADLANRVAKLAKKLG